MAEEAAPSAPAIAVPALSVPNQITVTASDEDVRSAVWIGHKWTRRLVLGGGSLIITAIIGAAGLWGDASLDAQRGMRADMAAMRAEMAALSKEMGALAVSDKARDLEYQDHERRIEKLERREELLERYDRALTNYEERHGITRATHRTTDQAGRTAAAPAAASPR